MRKAISKKLRFEVFKRDGFQCHYCGVTPPKAILQIDHIFPVAQGGTNDIDNLITSCQPCNLGKGANLLDKAPETIQEKAKLIHEKEEQLKGYYKIMQDREDRLEREMWDIAEIVEPMSSIDGINRSWLSSIRKFLDSLGFYEVKDAAEIARAKFRYGGKKTFLYFCGVCHNKIRG